MTELARLANSVSASDVIAIIARDGGAIIEDFLAPDTLEGLRTDLLPLLSKQATGRDTFSGGRTRRMGALFAHSRHMAEIATHPLYLPVAEHFVAQPASIWLGEELVEIPKDVRIGVTQAIQIGPGEGAQSLHRDDSVFLWRHPDYGCEARLQIMIAITDFTEENGGTLVIPASHRWDDSRAPKRDETVATTMKAGSALVFLGSLYHGGGENRTKDEYRTGVTMALDAANLRQEENMYLALKPELVASYPEQVQRLLGWSAGRTNMGWIEVDGQMADPNLLLSGVNGEVVGVGAMLG